MQLYATMGSSLRNPRVEHDCLSLLIKQPLRTPTLNSGFRVEIWSCLLRASFSSPVDASPSFHRVNGRNPQGRTHTDTELQPTSCSVSVLVSTRIFRTMEGHLNDRPKGFSKELYRESWSVLPPWTSIQIGHNDNFTYIKGTDNGGDLMAFFF